MAPLRYCYVCNEFTSSLFDEVDRIKEELVRAHPNDEAARMVEESRRLHYRFQKPSAELEYLKDFCSGNTNPPHHSHRYGDENPGGER